MKKLLLSLSLMFGIGAYAQTTILAENFNSLGDPLTLPAGWTQTNQSSPVGTVGWFRGGAGTTFAAYEGGQTGYIGANFNSTGTVGDISNWLMTPVLTLQNGDVISFYTRTATGSQWADNLEMRLSTVGAASTDPVGPTGVGSYTNLAVTVNPTFPSPLAYPQAWTQYTYTVSGLSGATDCRIAFRYLVPNGGTAGTNSNFIGVDSFSVTRPLAGAEEFFASTFKMFPNPAKDFLNLNANTSVAINTINITDVNGRTVKQQNVDGVSSAQIAVGDLNSGVYFVSVETAEGKGTAKFIKQ